jgi:nucleotide-binding universal stress UspA family protein
MKLTKILVPVDFSEEGGRALAGAGDLAQLARAALVLLHVVENVGSSPKGTGKVAAPLVAGTKQELELARGRLAELARTLPAGLAVASEVLVAPSVPHAINDAAARLGCDAIALSTHGRTGFRRMVIGSMTEAVLRGARVPVLVFPRQD